MALPAKRRYWLTVVTSFVEIVRAVRQVEAAALESYARNVAAGLGELVQSPRRLLLDVVVELANGERVGIEARSWLKMPSTQAFDATVGRLVRAVTEGVVARGILLVRRQESISKQRRRWAADSQIEVVDPDGLAAALLRSYSPPRPQSGTGPV
jgi:hypothetical protein